jgi:hypothetical protein
MRPSYQFVGAGTIVRLLGRDERGSQGDTFAGGETAGSGRGGAVEVLEGRGKSLEISRAFPEIDRESLEISRAFPEIRGESPEISRAFLEIGRASPEIKRAFLEMGGKSPEISRAFLEIRGQSPEMLPSSPEMFRPFLRPTPVRGQRGGEFPDGPISHAWRATRDEAACCVLRAAWTFLSTPTPNPEPRFSNCEWSKKPGVRSQEKIRKGEKAKK